MSACRATVRASLLLGLLGLSGLLAVPAARADQRHDWMIDVQPEGTYLNLDLVVGALQSTVEHRLPIYGNANQLLLRGGGVVAVPFSSGQADVDLRILNITLGVSGGGSEVWRNMTFEPDQPLHRKERREREAAGEFNSETFGFFEGRVGIAFPFNDYVVFNNVNAYRITGAPDRTFDYVTNVVHDGEFLRNDFQLFFKHRDWGGIAPMFQVLSFPLDDDFRTQFNVGVFAVGRAGLTGRNDLIALQVLVHSHDLFGGYDNDDVYGWALLRSPVSFLLAYRSQIDLWVP